MVDAGSSGCMTLPGLRKYIVEKSQTRVLALLNIACHGMAGAGCSGTEFGPGGENDHLNAIKLRPCIEAVEANRDLIVGIKVSIAHCGRIYPEVVIEFLSTCDFTNFFKKKSY